jgi:hypothetical protein
MVCGESAQMTRRIFAQKSKKMLRKTRQVFALPAPEKLKTMAQLRHPRLIQHHPLQSPNILGNHQRVHTTR